MAFTSLWSASGSPQCHQEIMSTSKIISSNPKFNKNKLCIIHRQHIHFHWWSKSIIISIIMFKVHMNIFHEVKSSSSVSLSWCSYLASSTVSAPMYVPMPTFLDTQIFVVMSPLASLVIQKQNLLINICTYCNTPPKKYTTKQMLPNNKPNQ